MTRTVVPAARSRRKRRPRLLVRLLRLVMAAVLAVVLWIGYALWIIGNYKPEPLDPRYDVGIVLGAALWNGEPSPGLRERLDHALALYEEGRFGSFILTGGYDHAGAKLSEAEGMRNYLADRGVPVDRMYIEPAAQSTYENLSYSKVIMEAEGFETALVITHDFHAARAHDVARYLQYERPGVSPAATRVLPAAQQEPREVLAFTKWKLDSVLLRFGLMIPDRPGL